MRWFWVCVAFCVMGIRRLLIRALPLPSQGGVGYNFSVLRVCDTSHESYFFSVILELMLGACEILGCHFVCDRMLRLW